jgi:hypothetical protein
MQMDKRRYIVRLCYDKARASSSLVITESRCALLGTQIYNDNYDFFRKIKCTYILEILLSMAIKSL